MADLSTLFYKLMPFAPGLAESVALKFMLEASKSFCRQTMAIQQTLPVVNASTADVSVPNPSGLTLCGFMRISSGGYTLWSKSEQALDGMMGYADYKSIATASLPKSLVINDFNSFTLVPAPTGSIALTIKAAVSPTDATNVPDELVARWYEAVVSGALMELLSHPQQTYTNAKLAAEHAAVFKSKILEARIRVNSSNSRHGTRVVGPKFI